MADKFGFHLILRVRQFFEGVAVLPDGKGK